MSSSERDKTTPSSIGKKGPSHGGIVSHVHMTHISGPAGLEMNFSVLVWLCDVDIGVQVVSDFRS